MSELTGTHTSVATPRLLAVSAALAAVLATIVIALVLTIDGGPDESTTAVAVAPR